MKQHAGEGIEDKGNEEKNANSKVPSCLDNFVLVHSLGFLRVGSFHFPSSPFRLEY